MRSISLFPVVAFMAVLMAAANHHQKPAPIKKAISMVAPKAVHVPRAPRPGERKLLAFDGGDGCRPCRRMRPILASLEAKGYAVETIATETNEDLVRQYGVTQTPTFVVLVDGKELDRSIGMTSQAELERMLTPPAKEAAPLAPIEPAPQEPKTKAIPASATQPAPATKEPAPPAAWRLCLLYPRGDTASESLRKAIEADSTLAGKYRFFPIVTDTAEFAEWRQFGYPADRLSLVLIRPDRTRAYYRQGRLRDLEHIKRDLEFATASESKINCECVFQRSDVLWRVR